MHDESSGSPDPGTPTNNALIRSSQTDVAERLLDRGGVFVQVVDLEVESQRALDRRLDIEQEQAHLLERRRLEQVHELALLDRRGPQARELIKTVTSSLLQVGCLASGVFLASNGGTMLGSLMLGGVVYTFAGEYVMKIWKKLT